MRAALAAALTLFAAVALGQQCSPAEGGSPCSFADGVASLADPDGGDLTVGNPIHPVTGNKYQEDLDAPPLPGPLGLEIRRHYNSSYVAANAPWGRGWLLSYDTRVYRSGRQLQIVQADGRRLSFSAPAGTSGDLPRTPCLPAVQGQGHLYIEPQGYRWVWPQQRELTFDSSGHLVQIGPVGGLETERLTIARDAVGRITRITDPAGRSMNLGYDVDGHLGRIDHPAGQWRYQVDPGGRLDSVRAPDGIVRRYRHDDPAHRSRFTAITIAEPGGTEQVIGRWSYDAQGRAVSYRRSDGSELRMAFGQPSEGGRVSVLTNALGGRTVYTAAETGGLWRVTEIRGPGCAECGPSNVRMRYDLQGHLVARWRIGHDGFQYRRDPYGRVTEVAVLDHPDGGSRAQTGRIVARFEYPDHQTRRPSLVARPSVVEGKEVRVVVERDERGELLALTQTGYAPAPSAQTVAGSPLQISRSVRLHHETIGGRRLPVSLDGPLPNGPAGDPSDSDVTRFSYDERTGHLISVTSPGGGVRHFAARDASGRATVVVDSDGYRETEHRSEFDLRGNLVSLSSTGWLLDRRGQRVPGSMVHRLIRREYDRRGRLIRSVDPAGREIWWDRDAAGRSAGVRDSRGYRSVLSRDAEGQVKVAALHEPGSAQPLRASYFGRDPDGRLQSLLLPDGRQLRFHYGLNDRALGFTDPDGLLQLAAPVTGAARHPAGVLDDFGRLLLKVRPGLGRQHLAYDESGRVVAIVDAGGGRLNFHYDAAGRLLSSGPDPGSEPVRYAYEGAQLMGVDDPAQRTRYERDAFGRVTQTGIWLAGVAGGPKQLFAARDPVSGLLSRLGLADGQSIRIVRSGGAGEEDVRELRLLSPFWTATTALLRRWVPAEAAKRIEAIVPSALVAGDIEVHPFDGLVALRHGNGMRFARRFDPAGRTARLTSEGGQGTVLDWRYGYGAGPRLRTLEEGGAWSQGKGADPRRERFDYDPGGVLQQAGDHSDAGAQPGVTRTSSDRPFALAATEKDAVGRVVLDDRFRYAYTAAGQVSEVRRALDGRLVATYGYNHLGQRIRKTVHDSAGKEGHTVYFLWHGGRLVAELSPDGAVTTQYVALEDGHRFLPIAKLDRIPPAKGRRMQPAQSRGRITEAIRAIHTDHRGAPVAMSDARQRLLWRAAVASSGLASVALSTAGAQLNLRLPGQYWDAETGLHDNWHRTYDPRSGRYLQPDPLGHVGGPDAYRYAGGDPVNRTDPLGLYEIDVHYYMTFFLGVTAGLDPEEARIVALASQYVDNNPLTRPVDQTSLGTSLGSVLRNQQALLSYHFVLSGADGRTLPEHRNTRLTNPDSPQLRNLMAASESGLIDRNGSLQFLGEYLHALADTYSHRDSRNRPYDALIANCGIGHGHELHEPDLTFDDVGTAPDSEDEGRPPAREAWRREARTLEMELNLHRVLLGYGDPAQAKAPQEIEAVLRAFNAIREQEGAGKAADFSAKIAQLQSALATLGFGHLDLMNEDSFGYSERDAAVNRRVFLRNRHTSGPLSEVDFPGTCLEGGTRCSRLD